ncbi:protealysin inhibitor emfourin [Hafnia psychrotolerans]|uniref:Uncharacterized protein n=1 Tax=Hafnia psychrotolerans TaxID=1477018 RepID=A0ABQ1FW84_9GAMM|nr:protealysin inhibitor emfourin [Hafnia psychrotolerans]GGA30601.1 hypothetical protein GCM10011328_01420 [Hafnia psychrotolerans]
MKPLDTLDSSAVIEMYREGGIAFMPKLNGPRRVELAGMSDDKRRKICQLINQSLPYAKPPEKVGHGDQRYYRLDIHYATPGQSGSLMVIIPENQIPAELVELWKAASPDG